MKSFISKLILFMLIPLLVYAAVFLSLKYKLAKELSGKSMIILGDSQTQNINLPNCYNFSMNGTPYFVRYSIVEEFQNEIKNKRVYIAYNYVHLSKSFQNRFYNPKLLPGFAKINSEKINAFTLSNAKRYAHINDDVPRIDTDLEIYREKLVSLAIRLFYKEDHSTSKKIKDTTLILNEINKHFKSPELVEEDTIQRVYIDKLIRLLLKQHNEVVLLKMPLTNYFSNNVPADIKEDFVGITKKYPVRLLDMDNELHLNNNYNNFTDYCHLNKTADSVVKFFFIHKELATLKK